MQQLEQILSLADEKKIGEALDKLHFRKASKYSHFEFPLLDILDAKKIGGTDSYEDTFADKRFFAEVFEEVEGYAPYTFIVVTTLAVFRHLDNFEFPEHVDVYTNAPINPHYEQGMAKIKRCQACHKKFSYGNLSQLNDKLFCSTCFSKQFQTIRPRKRY